MIAGIVLTVFATLAAFYIGPFALPFFGLAFVLIYRDVRHSEDKS